ncbi:MAG: F0F1 ATP synthase subunit A [Edaphocola sp.]
MLTICKRLLSVLFFTVAASGAFAQEEHAAEAGEKKEGFDASEVIFGHISDAHDWHFFDLGEKAVSIPLPVILYSPERGVSAFMASAFEHGHASHNGYRLVAAHYAHEKGLNDDQIGKIIAVDSNDNPTTDKVYDLSITKNVASMLISFALLILIMVGVANKYKKNGAMTAPSGFQNALEPVIIFIRDEVAKPNLGKNYMRFMPLLLTVFFFIWINNLLGLFPGGANFTGNIAVTAALALVSFIVIVFSANKHFWGHLFNPPGVPFTAKILLVLIEIISLFIKPIALTIRLFANILAGHIIILSVISMIFIFGSLNKIAGWGFAPVSIAFSVFMFCLELLVAAIQAFIFTNLTAVFIGQGLEDGHHEADEHGIDHAHSETELAM